MRDCSSVQFTSALLNMAAPGAVAASAGLDRAPTTPVEALGAAEEDASDPVMSFLEAVPWYGVSLSFL